MADDWARLGRTVKQWRKDRRLSQERISANGGPSDIVISRIERNEPPHPRGDTLVKLDAGMEWRPGSSVSVLRGGDPVPIHQPVLANSVQQASEEELILTISEASAELQRRLLPDDGKKRRPRINPDAPKI